MGSSIDVKIHVCVVVLRHIVSPVLFLSRYVLQTFSVHVLSDGIDSSYAKEVPKEKQA